MKKWIFLFCICTIYLRAVPFYENPSPEKAYQWLQENEIELAPAADWPRVVSLGATFIAQIIKTHPDYSEIFAQDFPYFSPLKKTIFRYAFALTGIQDTRIPETDISQMGSLSELDHMNFSSGHDFDLMFLSYIATGNELFIIQPMALLNSDPELLFYVYELHNRKFLNELVEEMTGQVDRTSETELYEMFRSWPREDQEQLVLRIAAWQCLDFIKKEDATAEGKISALCKNNPSIDYLGTLSEILK